MLSLRTMLTFFFCAILADTVLHRSLAFCVSKTLGIITVRDISFWLNSFVAYCRFSVCWLGTKKPKELLTRADLKGNFCIPVSLFVLSICADAHVHISSWVTGKFLIWSCTCIPYTPLTACCCSAGHHALLLILVLSCSRFSQQDSIQEKGQTERCNFFCVCVICI